MICLNRHYIVNLADVGHCPYTLQSLTDIITRFHDENFTALQYAAMNRQIGNSSICGDSNSLMVLYEDPSLACGHVWVCQEARDGRCNGGTNMSIFWMMSLDITSTKKDSR